MIAGLVSMYLFGLILFPRATGWITFILGLALVSAFG
jgi:hypothetical protein